MRVQRAEEGRVGGFASSVQNEEKERERGVLKLGPSLPAASLQMASFFLIEHFPPKIFGQTNPRVSKSLRFIADPLRIRENFLFRSCLLPFCVSFFLFAKSRGWKM
jgi:hypothetical protein